MAAGRWSGWHGDPSAAHSASALGVVLLCCAPMPRLVEPQVWLFWPTPLLQAARRAETGLDVRTAMARAGRPVLFDEQRGANGLPAPHYQQPAGVPATEAVSTPLIGATDQGGSRQRWPGSCYHRSAARSATENCWSWTRPGTASCWWRG
ncbi:hypothetical protein P3T34_004373 [Kitasatospora sp. MAP12-44]|uniref:hypothetical protein n=1 Tax=Kitasatospora sp. MAP12-44 TaxID=3035099 RepID=UPI002474184D|nr:hypothetical protein [Kitasatospora sp. MAP12-44]MDH6112158.1 hypothetical protein [Kitasatospora sp. MAP12-44]